jgi:tRNA-(ms[2]io[6]A)-hydroxylase
LAEAAREDDLRRLYRGLLASERGHFGLFLDLAKDVAGPEGLEARWEELRVLEAAILAAQPPGPRMHAGPGPRGGRRV